MEQLTYGVDGSFGPLTCPDGGVNTIAWHLYAYFEGTALDKSELLRLGPYANPQQVYQAMCYDQAKLFGTNPITARPVS